MTRLSSRPIIYGTRGLVTSGHYLASAAALKILQQGGNAIDAAAAATFCLNVVEQHETGPGGEVPILIYSAQDQKVYCICGVGWSPLALTIFWCKKNKIDLIPGDGFLPACVPAVIGSWALALQRFGTMSFTQVAQPAIELADQGFPMYEALHRAIVTEKENFEKYPSTCEIYLPKGRVFQPGEVFRNLDLAEMFRYLCRAEAEVTHKGRVAGIQAASEAFYRGEVAEHIIRFVQNNPVEDASGRTHKALLDYDDLAEWEATLEEPVVFEFAGHSVYKCPSWTQGPVFLQQLALLKHYELRSMGHNSPEYIHTLIECAKLAFADREAYYGDPRFDNVPLDALLSTEYTTHRIQLISADASMELRPGQIGPGPPDYILGDVLADNQKALGFSSQRDREKKFHTPQSHDTSQVNVIDKAGNMVAATPSGGWFPSSPLIRGLGFALGTRGQMFYLNPNRPNSLASRKRPRATLTPTLVLNQGKPGLVFGMRGGDKQDQHTLQLFLNEAIFGFDLQAALDAPKFSIIDFPNSFYPRKAYPGGVIMDNRFEERTIRNLKKRGHKVTITESQSNIMAIVRNPPNSVLAGGVCSSGEHAYALSW